MTTSLFSLLRSPTNSERRSSGSGEASLNSSRTVPAHLESPGLRVLASMPYDLSHLEGDDEYGNRENLYKILASKAFTQSGMDNSMSVQRVNVPCEVSTQGFFIKETIVSFDLGNNLTYSITLPKDCFQIVDSTTKQNHNINIQVDSSGLQHKISILDASGTNVVFELEVEKHPQFGHKTMRIDAITYQKSVAHVRGAPATITRVFENGIEAEKKSTCDWNSEGYNRSFVGIIDSHGSIKEGTLKLRDGTYKGKFDHKGNFTQGRRKWERSDKRRLAISVDGFWSADNFTGRYTEGKRLLYNGEMKLGSDRQDFVAHGRGTFFSYEKNGVIFEYKSYFNNGVPEKGDVEHTLVRHVQALQNDDGGEMSGDKRDCSSILRFDAHGKLLDHTDNPCVSNEDFLNMNWEELFRKHLPRRQLHLQHSTSSFSSYSDGGASDSI